MKKYMLYTLKIIWMAYEFIALGFIAALLLLLAIFGGSVDIIINWHSYGDLIKHFKVP